MFTQQIIPRLPRQHRLVLAATAEDLLAGIHAVLDMGKRQDAVVIAVGVLVHARVVRVRTLATDTAETKDGLVATMHIT